MTWFYSPHGKFDAMAVRQRKPHAARVRALVCTATLLCGAAFSLATASTARAQDSANPPGAPPGTIARVTGYDISVDGGNSAPLDAVFNAPSVYVSSGSVVTVHSGDAHMVLTSGGQVDICGPAKFTMLVSGGAITIALNFGRVHATLPATSQVRIFTPTIVATPIDISGNQRDITAGLDLNDSLCVRATSGALKLEQQFTGEDLIVPQSGEFFLADGKLLPVAGKPGSCDCVTTLHAKNVTAPLPNIPLLGLGGKMPAPAPTAPEVAAENSSAPPPQNMPVVQPDVTLHAININNDAHPVAPQPKPAEPPKPLAPSEMADYKIIAPPMTFSSTEPQAPQESANEIALLVRTVHVEPEWQFTGRVQPPGSNSFANASVVKPIAATTKPTAAATAPTAPAPALPPATTGGPSADDSVSATTTPAASSTPQTQPKKSGGFWTRVKHAFGG
jgi:hypothetical protein